MRYALVLLLLLASIADAQTPSRCEMLRTLLGVDLLNCWDFETPEQGVLQDPGRPGEMSSPHVRIDSDQAHTGTKALRFETESFNTASERCPGCTLEEKIWRAIQSNTRWWNRNIKPDLSATFGPGDGRRWFQYAVRDNAATHIPGGYGGDGSKKHILDVGDRWVTAKAGICQPLPASAGAGTWVRWCNGDRVEFLPKIGTVVVGSEVIAYQGKDLATNALKIKARGAVPADHEQGTAAQVLWLEYAAGCMDQEFPISAGRDFMPKPYHSCGVKDKRYEGFGRPLINASGFTTDWIMQPGDKPTWNDATKAWENYCSFNKIRVGDLSNCIVDKPEEWAVFTFELEIASYYHNDKRYQHDTVVKVWRNKEMLVHYDPTLVHPRTGGVPVEQCQTADLSKPVLQWPANRSIPNANLCLGGYDWARGGLGDLHNNFSLDGPITRTDTGGKLGLIWLGQMSWHRKEQLLDNPNAWPVCCHAPVVRWFDDVVFSTAPIPLPDGTYPPNMGGR